MKTIIIALAALCLNLQAYGVPVVYDSLIYKVVTLSEEGEDYQDTVAELINNKGNVPEINNKEISIISNQIIDSIEKRGCKVNDRFSHAYQIDSNLIILEIGQVHEHEFLFKENICGVVLVIRIGKELKVLARHNWRLYDTDMVSYFNFVGITIKDSLLIIGEQTYVRPFYNIYHKNKTKIKFIKRITIQEPIK